MISTGSISFDAALGVGGFPRGRVMEIFGPESVRQDHHYACRSSPKRRKPGGMAAFIDAEHALDPIYARKLGVDVDNLLVSQPDYGEQALEIAEALVARAPSMCWWWTRSRPWFPKLNSKARWAIAIWDCRRA